MAAMSHVFTARLTIRQYELNSRDELPNRALAQFFQETAMRASADAGYGVEWYTAHRSVWVIHQMTLECLRPIHYPDVLEITTWLSDAQRVRTHREYLARNAATGETVARGRAHWAHLDRHTHFPARIPPEIIERLAPNGIRAVQRLEPRAFPPPDENRERAVSSRRRVQRYEADAMQHVNNAIYLDWLEEALSETVSDPHRLCVCRHDIEYLRGALPGDEVEISTRLIGQAHCAGAWEQRVTRAGELLVRDRVTTVWRDEQGRPARWPPM